MDQFYYALEFFVVAIAAFLFGYASGLDAQKNHVQAQLKTKKKEAQGVGV